MIELTKDIYGREIAKEVGIHSQETGGYEETFLKFIYNLSNTDESTLLNLIYSMNQEEIDLILERFENTSEAIALVTYTRNLGYTQDISLFDNYLRLINEFFVYSDSVYFNEPEVKYLSEEMLEFAYKHLWHGGKRILYIE